MLSNPLVWLKLLLWIVAAMHLVVGAGFNLAPGFPRYMADVYGAEVHWTSEFSYILRPLGAFMVTLGLLAIAAAMEPQRHRVIIYGFVFLFLSRALQRIVWAHDVQTAFGISAERNVANMVFFTFIALSLLVLDLVVHRRAAREPLERAGCP
jgi:hypothetical protein